MMDVPVPFKPTGRNRHLSSGEIRRRSERATSAGLSSLLCSPEFEQWNRRKTQRRQVAGAAACLLLSLMAGIWLSRGSRPALSTAPSPSELSESAELSKAFYIIRGAAVPEKDGAAAVGLISGLHKGEKLPSAAQFCGESSLEVLALRTQVASLKEVSEKLRSRLTASSASSAKHERTAQQSQVQLQSCRASAAGVQQQAASCSTELAGAAKEKRATQRAHQSALLAAAQHEKAARAAAAAQAEHTASLTASQQEAKACVAELILAKQKKEEASASASACRGEFRKVAGELEYALSDSEALIERTAAARLRAAGLLAAGLALAILLTAAYTHRTKRKIVSLQLEREKLLLDKMEAETGGGLLRRRTPQVPSP